MTFEIELKIRFNGDYVFNREKGIITIENDKIFSLKDRKFVDYVKGALNE